MYITTWQESETPRRKTAALISFAYASQPVNSETAHVRPRRRIFVYTDLLLYREKHKDAQVNSLEHIAKPSSSRHHTKRGSPCRFPLRNCATIDEHDCTAQARRRVFNVTLGSTSAAPRDEKPSSEAAAGFRSRSSSTRPAVLLFGLRRKFMLHSMDLSLLMSSLWMKGGGNVAGCCKTRPCHPAGNCKTTPFAVREPQASLFAPGRNRARVKACLERCEYTRIMCDLARALYQPSRYSVERGSCCTPDSQGPNQPTIELLPTLPPILRTAVPRCRQRNPVCFNEHTHTFCPGGGKRRTGKTVNE